MSRVVLIDGNSILNRAFYGIMGSKMLMTTDGTYTNAVYGFLAIMFKVIDDLQPEYMMVAFDLKAPTARHKMYEGYKANRKGMPNELAAQMPILKDILHSMNIPIIEKEGYEADDVLGTLSKRAESDGYEVTIVSGDRDTFQLTSDKVTVRIPRTKIGKTEIDNFDREKVMEIYGLEPKQLIEVKGLMGDTSDNIPGVPGVGEKTAISLIKEYGTMQKIYEVIEEENCTIKEKLKEKLAENKELAFLSRTLGTINLEVPIEETIEDLKVQPWKEEEVLNKFKELNFNRFIDRFHLQDGIKQEEKKIEDLYQLIEIKHTEQEEIQRVINQIKESKKMIYTLGIQEINGVSYIIKKEIISISIYEEKENTVFFIPFEEQEQFVELFKEVLEQKEIGKFGHQLAEDYVLFRQLGIKATGFVFDAEIAAYDINPTNTKYHIEELTKQYLELDMDEFLSKGEEEQNQQINLFHMQDNKQEELEKKYNTLKVYMIHKLSIVLMEKLEKENAITLFQTIEMPLVEVLGEMQYNGIYVDKEELIHFGESLKEQITVLTNEIYELCGEEFNINSTQQLGKILFEKLELPIYKKTKTGYSTDVDILEKLKSEHPVIEKILEYRSLMKLNSTYVEGLIPYINEETGRIHSYFHQTITATGRISSTEPNLQNIPTRTELGRKLRKVFKPQNNQIFIDADYSQVELRVLAHISQDETMLEAFQNGEDIHKQAASKVLNIPIDKVTKEERASAKAVNFGIVYGISDFGLAEQIGVSKKKAKIYIEQYLEKYSGIKKFMDDIVEQAKQQGYVETLFHRRRYIPEITSNNYMVRQFGSRAAMNTPIQGTAADIMKLAMIHVYEALEKENLKAKLILQIHDELLIECPKEEKEKVKEILKECMENAITLSIPLEVETSEGNTWYQVK